MWKEGGCESGIGLHGLINGLNCFEESTIAHAKHRRPRVGEILSLLIKWKMQIESVLHKDRNSSQSVPWVAKSHIDVRNFFNFRSNISLSAPRTRVSFDNSSGKSRISICDLGSGHAGVPS